MGAGCTDCREAVDLKAFAPAYRRALVWVVGLNLGMGLVELVGGFFARSQALKADSLDFLGDAAITGLALLAMSRPPRWRTRVALLQGWFLAALALGVLAAAGYRAFSRVLPEAPLMTGLGIAGFAVNITAALLLVKHRKGDASVTAVWLFSRNDAIANVAVVIAAGLVHWTQTPWPDLATAVVIAGLFTWSAVAIIAAARREIQMAPHDGHVSALPAD